MSELVSDCPRCRAKSITFDVLADTRIGKLNGWQSVFEVFSVCRRCNKSTIFVLVVTEYELRDSFREGLVGFKKTLNQVLRIEDFISLKNMQADPPPEFLPPKIESIYREGASSLAIKCYNAAGTMFRLCLDLATKELMPQQDIKGLNARIRGSLGLRLGWLFENGSLPASLKELSSCVKDDGNDGAHDGTLKEEDAEDLKDFTFELLERLYTEPKRLEIAKQRREDRRTGKA